MNFKRQYGWQPQLPDIRDHQFVSVQRRTALPVRTDLRAMMPAVYDQGQLGSCTAHAAAAVFAYATALEKLSPMNPSRLFIYYNERKDQNTITSDSGATLRGAAKVLHNYGVCDEIVYPYNVSKFKQKPPPSCYTVALKHESTAYTALNSFADMLQCLADGYPFMLGFSVYDEFESDAVAKSGVVPMPAKGSKLLGGHAVACVGYDNVSKTFLCRNSWGKDWGIGGYFTLPFDYMTNKNLASDFWKVSTVS